jgi:hypothetical protein
MRRFLAALVIGRSNDTQKAGVGCGEFTNRTNRKRCGARCLLPPTELKHFALCKFLERGNLEYHDIDFPDSRNFIIQIANTVFG